jgi:hypothetical protein
MPGAFSPALAALREPPAGFARPYWASSSTVRQKSRGLSRRVLGLGGHEAAPAGDLGARELAAEVMPPLWQYLFAPYADVSIAAPKGRGPLPTSFFPCKRGLSGLREGDHDAVDGPLRSRANRRRFG